MLGHRRLLALCLLAFAPACVDAPITSAHLQEDGRLKQGHGQSLHAVVDANPAQRADSIRLSGALASEPAGPLTDSTNFDLADEAIYLHLRAEQLGEPRAVRFVWSHGEELHESIGALMPTETLTLAASHKLEDASAAEGQWLVQVFSTGDAPETLLYEREFEIDGPGK